jgi:hypothetical protein
VLVAIAIGGTLGVAYAYNVVRNVRGHTLATESCARIEAGMTARLSELQPALGLLFENDGALVEGYLRDSYATTCSTVEGSLTWWHLSYGAELTINGDADRRQRVGLALGRARERCPEVYRALLEETPFLRDADPELKRSATDEVCGMLTRSLDAMAGRPATLGVWEWPEHLARIADALDPTEESSPPVSP